jgi:arginine-tRNA-protein transferase
MTQHPVDAPQFFLTAPSPCPYLPDRRERKVFTHLVGNRAAHLNNVLSQGGFRRSQNIAYRPACDGCRACISVRVVVDEFVAGASFRRCLRDNADLVSMRFGAAPTAEQYSLFRAYLDARHCDGGMADMTVLDFAMMVEDTQVNTMLFEYRLRPEPDRAGVPGRLIACALTDVLDDGLSMVYSFFDPDLSARGLGTFMVLDHIAKAKAMGLPHVYLGYWVAGSRKMDYKRRFKPLEYLDAHGWTRQEPT